MTVVRTLRVPASPVQADSPGPREKYKYQGQCLGQELRAAHIRLNLPPLAPHSLVSQLRGIFIFGD